MYKILWVNLVPFCLLANPVQAQIRFRTHLLNADSEFSAAATLDVNEDGQVDIVSGAWWYRAPDWQRFRFREVEQIRGRYDDYSNLPLDVDGDGDQDLVSVNYRSESLYWCRNPGKAANDHSGAERQLWERIVIDRPGPSETGRLVDIDGDGKLDILPNGTKFAAWYEFRIPEAGSSEVTWLKHDLPAQLIGHGIGAGDLNGDGRTDVVGPHGWAEAPEDPRKGRWIWHADFRLAPDSGLPILCHDVDGDGDTDLIWGRGHNIGLYWTEQVGPSECSISFPEDVDSIDDLDKIQGHISTTGWIAHAIDTRWATLHTLMLADMDGDGTDDLVTGRRFMGHDGKDPGENDPLGVAWYRFQNSSRTWVEHPVTFGGTCGIDLDSSCADLDGDGDMDILAPARSGLHWIENLRIADSLEGAQPLEPVLPHYSDHQDVGYFIDGTGASAPIKNALDHGVRRQHILGQMELAMGRLPQSERRVPLKTSVESIEQADGYWRIKLTYVPERGDHVPAFLLVPRNLSQPAPGVLCLHPTHFELGKAQICGLGGQPSRFYAHELAQLGFVCLAPDYPSFADYTYDFASDDYQSGTMKAIWNNMRAIDLLESLPCVDLNRIGVIGHSLGGHNGLFTAAFDQRVDCVVSSCGFTAFEDYYAGDITGWTSERYMPSLRERYALQVDRLPFDFPEVLAAIAPRPVFVNAPLEDSNFAVQGVRKCEQAVLPIYEMLEVSQRLKFVYPQAEHDFPSEIRQQAYAWLAAELAAAK